MTIKTQTTHATHKNETAIVTPLTEEQRQAIRAVTGRRKGGPSMDRLIEEVEKFREVVRQEEIDRQDKAESGREK